MIVEMLNRQNRAFMRRPFREVHSDYLLAKSSLAQAKAENLRQVFHFIKLPVTT